MERLPVDPVARKERELGRRGDGRRNRLSSRFDEIGFNGGSSTASWMLDITSMLESRSLTNSAVRSAVESWRKRKEKRER